MSDPAPPGALDAPSKGRPDASRTNVRLSALMRAAQAGDQEAYVELLEEITPVLRRVVTRRRSFMEMTEVEDLVQDVLVSVHSVRATYDPDRPFLPWLLAITRNRLADGARRWARHAGNEVTVEDLDVTFATAAANTDIDGDREKVALHQAIRDLPRGQRSAIELLKLKEMSLKEASEVSGMSVGALKVATHRAIGALRKVLTRADD